MAVRPQAARGRTMDSEQEPVREEPARREAAAGAPDVLVGDSPSPISAPPGAAEASAPPSSVAPASPPPASPPPALTDDPAPRRSGGESDLGGTRTLVSAVLRRNGADIANVLSLGLLALTVFLLKLEPVGIG